MRYVMYFVIVAVTTASYLVSLHLLPASMRLLPEALSGLVAVYIAIEGARQHYQGINQKYWIVFGAFMVVILCGVVANSEPSGPMINGLRFYLRCIPFFFVPAICRFDEAQLLRFMKLLLVISLAQIPLTIQERLALVAAGRNTGDLVHGSLMISGILTLFLICVIAVMVALTMRRRLSTRHFVMTFIGLLIPMSINETKVTVVLLPLALLTTFIAAAPKRAKLRTAISASILVVLAGAIFVPLYNYLSALNSGYDKPEQIQDYFTNQKQTTEYLDANAGVGTRKEAGRVDSVVVPFQELSRDPIKFAFGLGVGNVTQSQLGASFTGRYYDIYGRYNSSLGIFLLETGLFGVALIAILHWMILSDALQVARNDSGLVGIVAIAWPAVVAIASLGLFYVTLHIFESFTYLFWFFSGWIATQRTRINSVAGTHNATHAFSTASGISGR